MMVVAVFRFSIAHQSNFYLTWTSQPLPLTPLSLFCRIGPQGENVLPCTTASHPFPRPGRRRRQSLQKVAIRRIWFPVKMSPAQVRAVHALGSTPVTTDHRTKRVYCLKAPFRDPTPMTLDSQSIAPRHPSLPCIGETAKMKKMSNGHKIVNCSLPFQGRMSFFRHLKAARRCIAIALLW